MFRDIDIFIQGLVNVCYSSCLICGNNICSHYDEVTIWLKIIHEQFQLRQSSMLVGFTFCKRPQFAVQLGCPVNNNYMGLIDLAFVESALVCLLQQAVYEFLYCKHFRINAGCDNNFRQIAFNRAHRPGLFRFEIEKRTD